MGHVAHWSRETILSMSLEEFEEEFESCLRLHNQLNRVITEDN